MWKRYILATAACVRAVNMIDSAGNWSLKLSNQIINTASWIKTKFVKNIQKLVIGISEDLRNFDMKN